jgi:hypothetical protein
MNRAKKSKEASNASKEAEKIQDLWLESTGSLKSNREKQVNISSWEKLTPEAYHSHSCLLKTEIIQ